MAFNYTEGFEHMEWQDHLPKRWRELVYEYGARLVETCLASRMDLRDAREYCESHRQERQCVMNRLLCGPKIIAKSSFFRLLPKRDQIKTDTDFGVRRKIQFTI